MQFLAVTLKIALKIIAINEANTVTQAGGNVFFFDSLEFLLRLNY